MQQNQIYSMHSSGAYITHKATWVNSLNWTDSGDLSNLELLASNRDEEPHFFLHNPRFLSFSN